MTTRPFRLLAGALALSAMAALAPHSAFAQSPLGNSFKGLQVEGDKPIAIESDQLDVDDGKAMATFTGNVSVSQGETLIKTSKLLVYYKKTAPEKTSGATAAAAPAKPSGGALPGGSNQIDRIEASGKVYIKSTDQVATAESANFDMKTQIAILDGNVVLSQGDNVVRGPKLTIHMDTGIALFDGGAGGSGGRIKILMAPQQGASGTQ